MKVPGRRAPFPSRQLGEADFALRTATGRWRALPDFLVIGAAKSATTSLHRHLAAHPDIFPPLQKEIRYFHTHYERGERWYRAHFPTRHAMDRRARHRGRRPLTFEASTGYLSAAEVPARAAALLPDAKLVAMLRNPVDRAISAYHMRVRRGDEHRPIGDALTPDSGYALVGRYADQLERWLGHYPREQLLVIQSEALIADLRSGLDQLFGFLGLPSTDEEFTKVNAGTYEATTPAVRQPLVEYFAEPNERLWDLLGTRWEWADWTP